MRISKIRIVTPDGVFVPTTTQIMALASSLRSEFSGLGFITKVRVISNTEIKIGLGMCSFRIDRARHSSNLDIGYSGKRCKRGYKLTTTPTWEQREQFNHGINDVLDRFFIEANAKNSVVKIRDYEHGRISKWSPYDFPGGERAFYDILTPEEFRMQKEHDDEQSESCK